MAATKYELRPALAEFLATALFVWLGCGSAVSSQAMHTFSYPNHLDQSFLVAVSLTFGLALAALVYSVANISGGHLNPAVTFAMVTLGRISIPTSLMYVIAQCLGALLGAALVWGTVASPSLTNDGTSPPFDVGMNSVNTNLPMGSAFLGECLGTFLLVWTVIMTTISTKSSASVKNLAPMIIGWVVTVVHFVLIPLTGCGINPARSFGPMMVHLLAALIDGSDQSEPIHGWWVYFTAPFVGSGAAVLVWRYIFDDTAVEIDNDDPERKDVEEGI